MQVNIKSLVDDVHVIRPSARCAGPTVLRAVSGCVKMVQNRSCENVGGALGSRRCDNAGCAG